MSNFSNRISRRFSMSKTALNKVAAVVRHGDVSLHRVSAVPSDAKLVADQGDFILAYGETTGHTHKLVAGKHKVESTDPEIAAMFTTGKFKVYETKDGVRFVEVEAPTPLKHQEHRTIVIPEGIYKQEQEREEDPFSEATAEQRVRRVID